jgi:YbbR domain-containing protein
MAWRDLLLKNRWQKAFSVLLASLIWFAVQSDNSLIRTIPGLSGATRTFSKVPVGVLTRPEDSGRYKVTPASVEVVLQGDAPALAKLETRDVEAYVNLGAGLGATGQSITVHVRFPGPAQLAWVTPAEVTVEYLPAGK